MRFPARLTLIKISAVIFVLAILVIVFSFIFPKTGLGQSHLKNKASKTFAATYDEFNKQFDNLPLQKATFNNQYCNELRGRELRKDEADWAQECSRLKIIEINAGEVKDFPDRLVQIENWLGKDGWHFEKEGGPSKTLTKISAPNTVSHYIKTSDSTECGIIFKYDHPASDKVFSIYEYCNYYRNISDL